MRLPRQLEVRNLSKDACLGKVLKGACRKFHFILKKD